MLWSCRFFFSHRIGWRIVWALVTDWQNRTRGPPLPDKKKRGLFHTATHVTSWPRRQLIQSETIAQSIFVAHFTSFVPHRTPTNVTQSKKHVNLTRKKQKKTKENRKQRNTTLNTPKTTMASQKRFKRNGDHKSR